MSTQTKPKSKIYGLKANDKLVYVGKTHNTNKEGELIKSNIQTLYANSKLRKFIVGKESEKDFKLVDLQDTNFLTWYYDRNKQASEHYKNGETHLVNDPWILEGKNGYWEGKKRDKHTLKRLSESKFKRIVRYKKNGEIKRIYRSAKEVGSLLFDDYVVENGSSKSKIYHIMKAKTISGRKINGNYFFYEEELREYFSCIPKKLNIKVLLENEKREKNERKKFFKKRRTVSYYKVQQYDLDANLLHEFDCAEQAAHFHGVHKSTITKACKQNHNRFLDSIWVYGFKHEIKCDEEGRPLIKVYKGTGFIQ